MRGHFLYLLFWLFAEVASAQSFPFDNYNSENGLSQNSGYAVAQTPEGFIWMGTQNGLNRYDSHSFISYKHTFQPQSLCNNFITTLCADYMGNLWVGTESGVCVYDRYFNRFFNPSKFAGTDSVYHNMVVTKIKSAGKSGVWIAVKGKGVYLINFAKREVRNYLNAECHLQSLRDLTTDEHGNAWVSMGNEIFRWVNDHFECIHVHVQNGQQPILQDLLVNENTLLVGTVAHGLLVLDLNSDKKELAPHHEWLTRINSSKEITRLLRDSKGNVWIGTAGDGLLQMDRNNKVVAHFKHIYNNSSSLASDYILSLFEDRQGIIWIGTSGGGFSKYDRQKLLFKKVSFVSKDGTTSNMILDCFPDSDSTIYVGTLSGGFIRSNGDFTQNTIIKNIPGNSHSLLHNTIYDIAKDNSGLIWLATKAGLCSYNPRLSAKQAFTSYAPSPAGAEVFLCSIIKLSGENSLLVSGYNGIFKFDLNKHNWSALYDSKNYLSGRTIVARYMKEVSDNKVLLCTEGDGLIGYDYKAGLFQPYKEVNKITKTVRHAQLWQNNLWLATDNGLLRVDNNTHKVTDVYNSNNFLKDDVVYAILSDSKGELWISTNTGLARIDKLHKVCKYYDVGLGLQGMEYNTACCFKTSDGRLCFGGVNGLNIFDPDAIPESFYVAPPVITGIKILNSALSTNGNVSYVKSIVLPYNRNFVEINFAMPNFSYSEKNNYAYQLSGVDTGWVYCGNRRFANYTELKPGTYVFSVRSANSNGDWIMSAYPLSITIRPPWWATWCARIFELAAILSFFYLIIKWRINKIRKEGETQSQLLKYQLRALHAQMNPHFIFNCLASIKQLVLDGDKVAANRYLTKFSLLIRQTLEHSRHSFITLRQNNEYIVNYLEMEQLRFGHSFSFQFQVDNSIDEDDWYTPPLIIQPLVENAIWHGLRPSGHPGVLLIKFQAFDDILICTIEDNGVGLQREKQSGHDSIGIANIEQRLQLLQNTHHKEFSLKIMDKKTANPEYSGVKIELTLSQPQNSFLND